MKKTAILLGATGLTGNILLHRLLNDERYEKLILFSRSTTGIVNPKIEEHLIDLFWLKNEKEKFRADEVYCCIGTTKKKTPDENTYRMIDYGIPVTAAKLAAENGIPTFVVMSAMGADANSRMFYNRTKGEMERDVRATNVEHTYILRPSLIAGDRDEKRLFEGVAKGGMKLLDKVLTGSLKKYRSIHPETIAKAMIFAANEGYGKKIIESDKIQELAEEADLKNYYHD
ncbi:MAG: NAD(P)H-binding protein [Salegentibacter sp.]